MVFDRQPDEEPVISEGWSGGGALRDGQKDEVEVKMESVSDGEKEGEEVSRTESTRELTWRDEVRNGGDGSLADDEAEDDDEGQINKVNTVQAFTPLVTIVQPASKQLDLNESSVYLEEPEEKIIEPMEEPQSHGLPHLQHHPEWTEEKRERGCGCCGEIVILSVGLLIAAVMFPLFIWVGFEFLPIDMPTLSSAPVRLVYTLRCAFFATLPIILGVLVQGVSRFKFGVLKPLFEGNRGSREVIIHGNYVRDSLHLYLLYFIQLAVMATYIRNDMLKLVPLLTILFVFGRLIYWVCVVFGSSARSLGFGLSFLPVLVLLGVNLYFICSSRGPDSVFDVAPPTTAPPPKQRWWG